MVHREALVWRGCSESSAQATANSRQAPAASLGEQGEDASTGAPSVVPLGKHGSWHLGTACLVEDRRDPSHSPRPVVWVGVLQGFGSLTRQCDL